MLRAGGGISPSRTHPHLGTHAHFLLVVPPPPPPPKKFLYPPLVPLTHSLTHINTHTHRHTRTHIHTADALVSAPDPTDAAADGLHHRYALVTRSDDVIHPQLRPLGLGPKLCTLSDSLIDHRLKTFMEPHSFWGRKLVRLYVEYSTAYECVGYTTFARTA